MGAYAFIDPGGDGNHSDRATAMDVPGGVCQFCLGETESKVLWFALLKTHAAGCAYGLAV